LCVGCLMHLRWLVEASWVEFRSSSAHNDYFCRGFGSVYESRDWIFGKILGWFLCDLRKIVGDGAIATDRLRCSRQCVHSVQSSRIQTHRCCGDEENFQKKKFFYKNVKHFGGSDIFRKYRIIRELLESGRYKLIIEKKQRAAEVSSDEKPVGYWMLLSACTPYL